MLSKSETGQFTEWARAQQPWLQLPALLPSSSATLPPSLNCSVLQCCSCRTGINMRSLQPTTSSQLVLTCNLHITRSNRLFPSFYINCLENPMDRGAQQATVHRVAKSQTWLKQLSTHAHIQWWIRQIISFWESQSDEDWTRRLASRWAWLWEEMDQEFYSHLGFLGVGVVYQWWQRLQSKNFCWDFERSKWQVWNKTLNTRIQSP